MNSRRHLQLSDLESIERRAAESDELGLQFWRGVDRLSRSLRQSWIRVDESIELPRMPAALAVGRIKGELFAVVAERDGRVGVSSLQDPGDQSNPAIGEIRRSSPLGGFSPDTDEIRNIVLSPRRVSRETDVFISARRWPEGSGEPRSLIWRAVVWSDKMTDRGESRVEFRPVSECGHGRGPWQPVSWASDRALPGIFFDTAVQCSVPDALAFRDSVFRLEWLPRPEPGQKVPEVHRLALAAEDRVAVLGDGCVHWRQGGSGAWIEPPEHPVAACLSRDGGPLLLAGASGHLFRYSDPTQWDTHELEVAVAAMAAVPTAPEVGRGGEPGSRILVAGRDKFLTCRRWVGNARIQRTWTAVVEHLSKQLAAPSAWRTWAGYGEGDGPEVVTRLLLWLHAAWRDDAVRREFVAFAGERSRNRPGGIVGRELAYLIQTAGDDSALRQRAYEIYRHCGTDVREQVDRGRPNREQVDELVQRASINFWDCVSGNLDENQAPTRASALGHLATRPWLNEASWPGAAQRIGVLRGGARPALLLAGAGGIRVLDMPGPDAGFAPEVRQNRIPWTTMPHAEACLPPSMTRGVSSWIRSLQLAPDQYLTVLGGYEGVILIGFDGDRSPGCEQVLGDARAVAIGAVVLRPGSALNPPILGLAWRQGIRCWMDAIELRAKTEPSPAGLDKTVAASFGAGIEFEYQKRTPVPVAATALDVATIDGQRWMAAGGPTTRLDWLRWEESAGKWRMQASNRLNSAPIHVRFAIGLADGGEVPVLVFTTQGGRIWCQDAIRRVPLWVRSVGGTATGLEIAGRGPDLIIAVCGTPHRLTLLDATGGRVWRHRIGSRPSNPCFLPRAANDPAADRIAVLHEDGNLSLFRRSDMESWRAEAAGLAPDEQDGDRLRAARVLHELKELPPGAVSDARARQSIEPIEAVDPKRALLAIFARRARDRSAMEMLLDVGSTSEAPETSARNLAAMARELNPDAPIEVWEALWERAVVLLADAAAPDPRLEEMLVEAWAFLARCQQQGGLNLDPRFITDRIHDLFAIWPHSDTTASTALNDYPEAALQIALVWLRTLDSGACPDADELLAGVHLLPPEVAGQLPLLVGDPVLAAWLEALVKLVKLGSDADAYQLGLGHDPRFEPGDGETERAKGSRMLAVLAAMRELTLWRHSERSRSRGNRDAWQVASRLLNASLDVPPGAALLLHALREPGQRLPAPELPEPTWRLDRQQRWITDALAQRWQVVKKEVATDAWPGWLDAMKGALNQVEIAYRRVLQDRLADVVARGRARLDAQVLRWNGDELLLELSLSHDGVLALEDPRIEVAPMLGGRYLPPASGTLTWTPVELAPGDPPHRMRMRLRIPAKSRDLVLQVRCVPGDGEEEVTDWPLDLGEPLVPGGVARLLLKSPFRERLFDRIESVKHGLALLVLDPALEPEIVVQAICELPGTRRVDLDATLDGRDPSAGLARLQVLLGAPKESATRRIVFHPGLAWVDALLNAGQEPWRAFLKVLRDHSRASGAPPWLLVLDSSRVLRVHQALVEPPARAVRLDAALLDPAAHADLDLNALAGFLETDRGQAHHALVEANGDLRLLGLDAEKREASNRFWAREELAGLDPRLRVALVALAGARSRLNLNRIPEGAIAAERVETRTRKASNPVKRLLSVGDEIRTTGRLTAVKKEVLVEGLAHWEDLNACPREVQQMLRVSGFDEAVFDRLVRLGLVQNRGGRGKPLYVLRPDLACAIASLRRDEKSLTDCVTALGSADDWWRAVELASLTRIDADDLELLGIQPTKERLALCQAIGQLWAGGRPEAGAVQALILALTGTPPAGEAVAESGGALRVRVASTSLPRHRELALIFVPPDFDGTLQENQGSALEVLIGPGVDRAGSSRSGAGDAASNTPRFGASSIRELLRAADPRRAFWSGLRAQLDLELVSPFVQSAALPPGSPLFVGRTAIREEIANHLRNRSFLILGARQVGKTSLLNRIWFEARERDDVSCLYVDAQGLVNDADLKIALAQALDEQKVVDDVSANDVATLLDDFERAARRQSRMPVLLLNEIDGLLQHSPALLQRLRARHEQQCMRFVFVGYAPVLWSLDDASGPLWHFTQAGDGREFVLGPLERDEARDLLRWLTREPLYLQWADDRHESRGEKLLLDASHHIPWVLQDLCQALVAQLRENRKAMIELDDVRRVLERRGSFLRRLEEVDLAAAMGRKESGSSNESSGGAQENAAGAGGWLILLLLVAWRYLDWVRGGRNHEGGLDRRGVRTFSDVEILHVCLDGLKSLPLLHDERAMIERWLRGVPMVRFMRALTLTMIIGTVVEKGERLWTFQGDIYPLELIRAARGGRSLEDRMLDQAQSLLDALPGEEG